MAVTITGAMYSNSSVMWKHYNWVPPDPAKRYKFKAVVTDDKNKTSNISWFATSTIGGESFHAAGAGALARADVSYIEATSTGAEIAGTQVYIGFSLNRVQLPGTPPTPSLSSATVTFLNYSPNGRLKVDWAGADAVGADDPNTDGVHAPPWPASRYYWYWKSSSTGVIRGSGYTAYATSGTPSPSEITFDAIGYNFVYFYIQSMGDYYNGPVSAYKYIQIPSAPKPYAPNYVEVLVTADNDTGPFTCTATWEDDFSNTGDRTTDGYDWDIDGGPEILSGKILGAYNTSVTFIINAPYPAYTFWVRAFNKYGASPYEYATFVAGPPPKPPQNVTFTLVPATGTGNPELTVSWDPVPGEVLLYGLDLWGPISYYQRVGVYAPETSYTFTLTETGLHYFQIRAIDRNQVQGPVGEHYYEVTEGRQRPPNWEWHTPKVQGGPFNMTAVEWNAFYDRINEFNSYVGYNQIPATNFSAGEIFTNGTYTTAMAQINQLTNKGWTVVFAGDDVLAADINALRDNLNSIP